MADFGYNTIGTAGNDNPADNWIWIKATSTPASNGTLDSITVRAASKAALQASICLALYTDSAGAPGSLVQANETPITGSDPIGTFSWRTQTGFSASITSGTQYWFGIRVSNFDGNHDIDVKYDTNGSATEGYFKNNAALAVFPASVSGATSFANERWSIYGTYTASGGGSTPFFGTTFPPPTPPKDVKRGFTSNDLLANMLSLPVAAPFLGRGFPPLLQAPRIRLGFASGNALAGLFSQTTTAPFIGLGFSPVPRAPRLVTLGHLSYFAIDDTSPFVPEMWGVVLAPRRNVLWSAPMNLLTSTLTETGGGVVLRGLKVVQGQVIPTDS